MLPLRFAVASRFHHHGTRLIYAYLMLLMSML